MQLRFVNCCFTVIMNERMNEWMNEFHASLYVVTTLPVHNRTDFSPMAGYS